MMQIFVGGAAAIWALGTGPIALIKPPARVLRHVAGGS